MSTERGRRRKGSGWTGSEVNPAMLQSYPEGVHYPTGKDSLIRTARVQGAPEAVIPFLQDLPDREHDSSVDVSREVGREG